MSNATLIRLSGITKTYGRGQAAFQALKGIDLAIEPGGQQRVVGAFGRRVHITRLKCAPPAVRALPSRNWRSTARARDTRDITVPSRGEASADWRLRSPSPGDATLLGKALTNEESDAVELTLPVIPFGVKMAAAAAIEGPSVKVLAPRSPD